MKKLALHWKILIGMVLGIAWGFISIKPAGMNLHTDWVKPWGIIFINLLKLIAVPLILVSLINGISNLTDITKLSRIGLKSISLYIISTVIAISVGLILVNATQPGNYSLKISGKHFRKSISLTLKKAGQILNGKKAGNHFKKL